jgi:hypothetical protein
MSPAGCHDRFVAEHLMLCSSTLLVRFLGAAHQHDQSVRKGAPPTQVVMAADKFLEVNLISFREKDITHVSGRPQDVPPEPR